MKHADEAMYASKRAHDGGWLVYQGEPIDEEGNDRSLASRIRAAVEHEEWVLYWQPMVDLGSGATVGAEALIRWHDVNGGIVPPGSSSRPQRSSG